MVGSDTRNAWAISPVQAAHQPQGQRHLCLAGERRVAAGEHQPESVVGNHVVGSRFVGRRRGDRLDQQRQLDAQRTVPAVRVEGPAARRGGQPCARVSGHAVAYPGVQRRHVRVLDALLGEVDVARDARRRGEHEGPLATVRVGDRQRHLCRPDIRVVQAGWRHWS
jgi:hypothetical protein